MIMKTKEAWQSLKSFTSIHKIFFNSDNWMTLLTQKDIEENITRMEWKFKPTCKKDGLSENIYSSTGLICKVYVVPGHSS